MIMTLIFGGEWHHCRAMFSFTLHLPNKWCFCLLDTVLPSAVPEQLPYIVRLLGTGVWAHSKPHTPAQMLAFARC